MKQACKYQGLKYIPGSLNRYPSIITNPYILKALESNIARSSPGRMVVHFCDFGIARDARSVVITEVVELKSSLDQQVLYDDLESEARSISNDVFLDHDFERTCSEGTVLSVAKLCSMVMVAVDPLPADMILITGYRNSKTREFSLVSIYVFSPNAKL